MHKPEPQTTAIRASRSQLVMTMVIARLQRRGLSLTEMEPAAIQREVDDAIADLKTVEDAISHG